MIIQVDAEGEQVVKKLIDAGIKSGVFGSAETVMAVLRCVKPIAVEEGEKGEKEKNDNDAVD